MEGEFDLMWNESQFNLTNQELMVDNDGAYAIVQFQYYVWGITGNIIAALGLVGNILSIIVLTNRRMMSSTSCYLIALAVFDSIVLISLFLFMALPTFYIAKGMLESYYKVCIPLL